MTRKQQRVLIKVVFYMARMIVYQGNVFGTRDTEELGKLVLELLEVFPEEYYFV